MMKCEHWIGPGVSTLFGVDEPDKYKMLEPNEVKCCEIEGETYVEVMTKYHEHMGWEPYKPMADDD